MVRLVLADDHELILSALRLLLETRGGFQVVGLARSARETLAQVRATRPDVVLLDASMPDISGLSVIPELVSLGASVIVLTAGIDEDERAEAFRNGARALLRKDTQARLLFDAIRTVKREEYWGPAFAAAPPAARRREPLTLRETEVLKAIVGGASNREVALALAISEGTVKHHLTRLFDKIGVSNRVELALHAVHHKLV
jgi:two-component system nitrate/nitrite response regulator NarL